MGIEESSANNVELDTEKLERFIKALSGQRIPNARIGILGGKAGTAHGKSTNAMVGAAHEYGTSTLPERSFLRVPIADRLNIRLENSDAFSPDVLKQVVKDKSIEVWIKAMATIAEGIVLEAFDTGGFGFWKPSDMTHKKVKQTLVETQQLRNAITSDVR